MWRRRRPTGSKLQTEAGEFFLLLPSNVGSSFQPIAQPSSPPLFLSSTHLRRQPPAENHRRSRARRVYQWFEKKKRKTQAMGYFAAPKRSADVLAKAIKTIERLLQ